MNQILELAFRCNKCGRYNARVSNIEKLNNAQLKCKSCGKSTRIRGKFGWNLQIEMPRLNEALSDCVARLNLR